MPVTISKPGTIALIMQTEDGRIQQIGITQEQSTMLQAFCAAMSKEQQFYRLPEQYDLILKSEKT